jgi:acyl-CoA synthetase (AMP-forming)/AMP-acid ligase II
VLLEGRGPPIQIAPGAHGAQTELSRTELLHLAGRLAQHFHRLGARPGDTLLVGLHTGPALLGAILGAWCAGMRVACIAPSGPLRRRSLAVPWIKEILDTLHPSILVAEGPILQAAKEAGAPQPVLVPPQDLPLRGRAKPDVALPRAEDVAVLQLTSGSTGSPRAIQVTHGNLVANIRGIGERVDVSPADRFVTWLPLHHDMGLVGGFFLPLFFELPLRVLPTETFVRSPMAWLEAMTDFRATMTPAPPFAFSMLGHRTRASALRGLDLSSWRVGFIGAETIYAESLERFVETFGPVGFRAGSLSPCYGLAEATLAVTMVPNEKRHRVLWGDVRALRAEGHFDPKPADAAGSAPFVGLGTAVSGIEIVIADETGAPLPEARVGRVLVRGTSVARAVQTSAGETLLEGAFDTGDLGFLVDGELFFASRAKDLILRGGANIAPSELERVAEEVEGVRRGCVAAFGCVRPELGKDEVVVVAETRIEGETERKAIADELRARVARDGGVQVDDVVMVAPGSVPKTTSGKVQRALCRQLYLDGELRLRLRRSLRMRLLQGVERVWSRLRS